MMAGYEKPKSRPRRKSKKKAGWRRHRVTEEKVQQVIELSEAGVRHSEIAKIVELGRSTVSRIIRDRRDSEPE